MKVTKKKNWLKRVWNRMLHGKPTPAKRRKKYVDPDDPAIIGTPKYVAKRMAKLVKRSHPKKEK